LATPIRSTTITGEVADGADALAEGAGEEAEGDVDRDAESLPESAPHAVTSMPIASVAASSRVLTQRHTGCSPVGMRAGACDSLPRMDRGNIPKLRAIPILAGLDDDALERIADIET